MIAETAALFEWAVVLAVQLWASRLLYRWFSIPLASLGVIALVGALALATTRLSGSALLPPVAAISAGVAIGLFHLFLYWLSGAELLLVVSVLLSFFASELWLSVPHLTGGSSGIPVADSSAIFLWSLLAAVVFLASAELYLRRLNRMARPVLRKLGLFGGVLGIPSGRIFFVMFAMIGASVACSGAAGASIAGMAHPSLFTPSWSISVLIMTVVPNIGDPIRFVGLPLACVFSRFLLRALLPVSVGYSQMADIAFPLALAAWSRLLSWRRLDEPPTTDQGQSGSHRYSWNSSRLVRRP